LVPRFLIQFPQKCLQPLVKVSIVNVAGEVEHPFGEGLPNGLKAQAVAKFFDSFPQVLPKEVMAPFPPGHTDNGEFGGQAPLPRHLINGRNDFALGEVPRGTKDDKNLRFGNAVLLQADAQGVFEQGDHRR
jgi:hypothetical protein